MNAQQAPNVEKAPLRYSGILADKFKRNGPPGITDAVKHNLDELMENGFVVIKDALEAQETKLLRDRLDFGQQHVQ